MMSRGTKSGKHFFIFKTFGYKYHIKPREAILTKQVCTRCINDILVPGISFDDEGVCSVCREYEKWDEKLNNFESLEKIWLERLEQNRGKGKYDILLGISGGKDSTFVLYKLLKEYNLNVLTFTVENGFLTDWAREKIKTMVDYFGVDHKFVKIPEPILSAFYNYSINMSGAPCTSCSYMVYSTTVALAMENNIPLTVHGRSRPQMLRYFSAESSDPFIPFIKAALKPTDENLLRETYGQIASRVKKAMPETFYEKIKSFFPDFAIKKPVEFLPYFIYHHYNETEMVEFLEKNTVWQRPDKFDILTHFDCSAHDAAGYLYEIVETRPHILPEVSVLARTGIITREEAFKRLEAEKFNKMPTESLDILGKMCGCSRDNLIATAKKLAGSKKL